jgi:lipopolysaccharide heptosyltransferase II
MKVLIAKLGATGDVVRTTCLLPKLYGDVVWLTDAKNTALLTNLSLNLQCFSWAHRELIPQTTYDLIINLEDSLEVAAYLRELKYKQWFGAYAGSRDVLHYSDDSHGWFDLSLISRYGLEQADRLKFINRRSYQELIFEGLGLRFEGEEYLLPKPIDTSLIGDIAIAAEAGSVWPMKKWAYYPDLKRELERQGLVVNILPRRRSLLEHLADVRGHRCLVGGDTLPMHFALGTATPCVTLFTCTSPWEIYDYDVQTKIISPLLEKFFYKRGYNERATKAISVDEVLEAALARLEATPSVAKVATIQ